MSTDFSPDAKHAIAAVTRIVGAFTKPDDDLIPACIFTNMAGTNAVIPCNYETDKEKLKFWNEVVPRVIRESHENPPSPDFRIQSLTFLTTAWSKRYKFDTPEEEAAIHEKMKAYKRGDIEADPQRQESALIAIVGKGRCEILLAPLVRTTNAPPVLGTFEQDENSSTGDFSLLTKTKEAFNVR